MAEKKKFLLRISPELWTDLESWAQAEFRSVNGQIEYILRDALNRRKKKTDDKRNQ
jgi:hypothetical protein